MTGELIFGVLVVAGLIWTAVWAWVMWGSPRQGSFEAIYQGVGRLRRRLLFVFSVLGLVALAASFSALPYPAVRALTAAPPAVTVEATGFQWYWEFSRTEVPAGVPVEFRVKSADVNHGFGLYSEAGELVAQVQAMPGYSNRLIHTFPAPGTYTVRCLELCGTAHHFMAVEIFVTAKGGSDGTGS